MPANPELRIYKCSRCNLRKVKIKGQSPDSWLILDGLEIYGEVYFCSQICMYIYLGQTPFGLEQMSLAIQRIVRGKHIGKTRVPKGIRVNLRKGNNLSKTTV